MASAVLAKGTPGELWFRKGHEAFRRSFPQVAPTLIEPFYVCPICLEVFTLAGLVHMTREHVPPKSVGGKRMVLTCQKCNNDAGSGPDSHMRREADVYDLAAGDLREIRANLSTAAGRVPIRLSASDKAVQMAGVVRAVDPDVHKNVMDDFGSRVGPEGQRERLTFKIEFEAFSPKQAATSWLRSAYLAFFAALGYRFIMRPELDVVRAKIRNPEQDEPSTFRITQTQTSAPMLGWIESPETLRSYAMFYRRNVILLPRDNDHTLYQRLADRPDTNVQFSGKLYPWPSKGPAFFDDQEPGASV